MSKQSETVKEWAWADGVQARVPADVAGPELERLNEKHDGRLSASVLLDEASKKRSPLRDAFVWDDEVAAHQWRLQQARQVLNGIRVVEITVLSSGEEESEPRRVFWNVPSEDRGEGYYTTSARLVDDDEARARAFHQLKNHLDGLADQLRQFEEFAGVVEEIDKVAA